MNVNLRPELEMQDRMRAGRLDRLLRQDVRKGLESGPAEPWDPEAIKKNARSRLGAAKARAKGLLVVVRLRPQAAENIAEVLDYVAEDNLAAADRWVDRLDEQFRLLATQPLMAEPGTSCRLVFPVSPLGAI